MQRDSTLIEEEEKHGVLIIDDDQSIVDSLELLLEENWVVFKALSAEEARKCLHENKVDVIVSDDKMPGETGIEFLSWVYHKYPGTMRILLTGYAETEKVIHSINDGHIWHYIRKPCENQELCNLIERALEFRQTRIQIRQSEQRYRELFHHAHVGIMRLQLDGRIIESNQSIAKSLGFSDIEDLIDLNINNLCETPEDWEILRENLISELTVGNVEIVLLDRQSQPVYLLVNASLRRTDEDKRVIEASMLDFTARRLASQENIELKEHLRRVQRQQTIATLSSGIMHDFNNQMTVVLSATFVAELAIDDRNSELGECVDAIKGAAEHAAELSRELLSFARRGGYNPQPVEINRIVNQTVRLLSWAVPHSIDVKLDLDENMPFMMGDSAQLHQCFLNLCLNACQAMDNGGTLTISTKTTDDKPQESVAIYIQDTGSGMTDEVREKAFEPFFSTKSNEQGGGTGLGLWMVSSIVQQHSGKIKIDSEPDKGTCFIVSFPSYHAFKGVVQEKVKPRITPDTGTIVLADDNALVRKNVGKMLTKLGFEVLKAQNGKEAVLHVIENPNVKLAILDFVMPLMDGEEAFRRIREVRPELPILFTTGYHVSARIHEALNQQDVHLLLKPFDPQDLSARIQEVLKR